MFNLDIGGFLTSTEFLAQIALIITAVLSAIVEGILGNFFGGLV